MKGGFKMKNVKALIDSYLEKIISYRRHIHENPELSHEEKETAAFIAKTLREIGLEPNTGVGGNGVQPDPCPCGGVEDRTGLFQRA